MVDKKTEGREISRRDFLKYAAMTGVAISAGPLLTACGGGSQTAPPKAKFPDKEIKMMIPWKAGSSSDRNARGLKPYLDKALGVPVVMENMEGASGTVGWTQYFKTAEPDGYNLVFTNWPLLYQSILFNKAPYKVDYFASLAGINDDPIIFLRHKDDNRWKDINDFIAACKEKPGEIKVSMTGPKSFQNLAAQSFMDTFGVKFQIVNAPGGSGEANTLLAGKHVDVCLTNAFSGFLIRDVAYGLGMMANRTAPKMWPEAKTIKELTGQTVPNLTVIRGFSVHSGIKEKYPDRYQALLEGFKKAMNDPDYKKQVEQAGEAEVVYYIPPEEMTKTIADLCALVDKYRSLLE